MNGIEQEQMAGTLLKWVKNFVTDLGLPEKWADQTDHILYTALIVLIGFLIARLALFIVRAFVKHILRLKHIEILRIMYDQKLFRTISHLIPPLFILSLLPLALEDTPKTLTFINKILWIYFVWAILNLLNKIVTITGHLILHTNNSRNQPLKGLIQLIQIMLYFFGAIVIVSIIIGKSPGALIGGLSAFAAVLMLVFKDTILGFVGGVQLSEYDMVRLGDWIEVPSTDVNGIVTDISLNTIKVQCWDNTIATIPPYSLISGPLKNWRGMSESGGRRIQRSYVIDINSIHFCTGEELAKIKNTIPLIRSYIEKKEAEASEKQIINTDNPEGLVNGTIETNLGLFRAYMTIYLKQHPSINQDLTLMVRSLAPVGNGFPLEIYCFSANKAWVSYESIQAEIMEHFAAILPAFGLYAFQNPSGRDYINAALLTAGQDANVISGLPWGTFKQHPSDNRQNQSNSEKSSFQNESSKRPE